MKKDFLTKRALSIQNKHDLLELINDLAKIEMGKEAFSFSIKQLCFYSNPDLAVNTYRHFDIPKKTGGERHIAAPNNTLRCIQHYVNLIFRAVYKPSECATGFTEGKSIVDNALKHVGQNYVFNIDLKDFFTSITRIRIYKRLQLAPFFYNKPVASILAGLCCVRDATDKKRAKQLLSKAYPLMEIFRSEQAQTYNRFLQDNAETAGNRYYILSSLSLHTINMASCNSDSIIGFLI